MNTAVTTRCPAIHVGTTGTWHCAKPVCDGSSHVFRKASA